MQLELIIILFSYFTGIIISFYIGYRFGKKDNDYIYYVSNPKLGKYEPIEKTEPEKQHKDESNIKPGIVYRPTAEELEKMHEPQQVKEAKEAVAETLRQEMPPQV